MQYGVQKAIAKINRINYSFAISKLGIDSMVSPKLITANYILRYVRGLQNAMGNPMDALYRIMNDQVEVVEFTANKNTVLLNTPLRNLNILRGILIAAIVRRNEIIIPHGNDVIKANDKVILIVKDKKLTDLNDIVKSGE